MPANQDLAATGTGASSSCVCGWASGTSCSQSQPSLRQARTSPATFASTAAAHEFALIAFRTFDPQGDRARVLALRIAGAANEFAVPAVLFHQAFAAERALFIERFVGLARLARAFHEAARGLAIRVARAGQERTEAPALDGHLPAAVLAVFDGVFALHFFAAKFRGKILNEIAIRVPRAAIKEAMPADALQ